jgi:hypothetical protein
MAKLSSIPNLPVFREMGEYVASIDEHRANRFKASLRTFEKFSLQSGDGLMVFELGHFGLLLHVVVHRSEGPSLPDAGQAANRSWCKLIGLWGCPCLRSCRCSGACPARPNLNRTSPDFGLRLVNINLTTAKPSRVWPPPPTGAHEGPAGGLWPADMARLKLWYATATDSRSRGSGECPNVARAMGRRQSSIGLTGLAAQHQGAVIGRVPYVGPRW